MTQVAVLVPGIMGSQLRAGGELVWPGPPQSLVFSFDKLPALLSEALVASDVIRSYSIAKQYGALLEDLHRCGFDERGSLPTLFAFAYDWRRDNALAAGQLADLLDVVVEQHRGRAEISLVAHSMGGLVSRCLLESGRHAARDGVKAVRRLLTLGTPHRGAPLALTAALGMERRLFLSGEQVRTIAQDPRYPSLYQLMPPPGEPFVWDRRQQLRPLDVYSKDVAQGLGLSLENLEAARAFHAQLSLDKRPEHVRYFFFFGTQQPTLTAAAVTRAGERWEVTRVESDDGGDGTVPIWSACLTGVQGRAVGGEHGALYRNDVLRTTLGTLLGSPVVLAPAPQAVEVALRDKVVEPSAQVPVALCLQGGAAALDGELRVERAELTAEGALKQWVPTGAPLPLRYAGPAAERLNVLLTAPSRAGVFRVGYFPSGAAAPAGSDELFVQA